MEVAPSSPLPALMPTDDLDRDRLYSAGTDDSDANDAELELEPVDPAVLAAEKRRADEAIEAHRTAIDINEVYRDLDANRDSEILSDWMARLRGYRFRFQVKHLLVLTAVVALLLAVRSVLGIGFGSMLVVMFMLAIGGVSLVLKLEENKRQQEANRRRQKMYAERRAQQARAAGLPVEPDDELDEPPLAAPSEPRPPAPPASAFRWQFSLGQLFAVTTVVALLLGVVSFAGGTATIATLCGLAALAGFVVVALGYEPPEIVVFGWWMLLALYVVLSVFAAIWTGMARP